jgi:FAD/FMN-containing dehydrogenase
VNPGLADDALPDSLMTRALLPGDPGYARYTAGFFRGGRPGLVLRPQSPDEVQDAVRYADRHRDVPLGILSGGHGISGRSLNDGGIVIAVDALNEITVLSGNRARLGPGARWGDVAAALAPHGLSLTAGDSGSVGVGGLATAGGIGDLVRASAAENPDLFWAMRGAGANFGIAVSFEFDLDPIGPQVGFAMLVYAPDDIAAFLQAWGTTIEHSHPTVTGTLILSSGGQGPATVQALIVVDADDPDTVIERLQPLAALAPLANQSVQLMPYHALLAQQPEQHGHGEPHAHSSLAGHLTPAVAEGLAHLLASNSSFFLTVRSAGGAVADTAADATAYAWRNANFFIATLGGGSVDFEERWNLLLPHFEGMYLSFETDTGPDVLARAFPPAHLNRLRALKRTWDPTGLFRDNFFIDPISTSHHNI